MSSGFIDKAWLHILLENFLRNGALRGRVVSDSQPLICTIIEVLLVLIVKQLAQVEVEPAEAPDALDVLLRGEAATRARLGRVRRGAPTGQ